MGAISDLRDYIDRTTHWREGGVDRHGALQAVSEIEDAIEWIEKGNEEWRQNWSRSVKECERVRATARIAIAHLQAVLNGCKTHDEQARADTVARDWLKSIGTD